MLSTQSQPLLDSKLYYGVCINILPQLLFGMCFLKVQAHQHSYFGAKVEVFSLQTLTIYA